MKQGPLTATRTEALEDCDGCAWRLRGLALYNRTLAPHINAGEEKQPHHVDEVPVPGRRLEAEMAGRRELAGDGAAQAHGQEDGADDHMGAVKARRHEEGRAIDRVEIASAAASDECAGSVKGRRAR